MNWIAKIPFYLRSPILRQKVDVQMSEERKLHLEMESKIAVGMSPEEARDPARWAFGNAASLSEKTRD